jgi:hypothetical protein
MLAILLTLSCSDSGGESGDPADSSVNALLLNFTSNMLDEGELRWMKTDSDSLDTLYLEFEQDSKVFAHNGKIFILERTGAPPAPTNGTLSCLTPPLSSNSNVVRTPLDPGSNPYDIAFIGTKGYIAQYGLNYIQSFNVGDCSLAETIPLPNVMIGNPNSGATTNAASIRADGNTLLVVMQRWNPYPSYPTPGVAEKGILVRIDAATKDTIDTIQLKYYNPQASVLSGGKLYIASVYAYDTIPVTLTKGGIEYVNLNNKSASDTLVSGTRLGGGATNIVLGNNGLLWTTVYWTWGSVTVKSVSTSDGTPSTALGSISDPTCMVYDDIENSLFVGNGTVYDSPSLTPSLKKVIGSSNSDVGNSQYPSKALPPYSLAIVRW